MMITNSFELFLLLLTAVAHANGQQLICYSKSLLQSHAIYSLYLQSESGFYVDVSPPHPVVDSSTIYLKAKGWTGINLLSSASALAQFSHARPDDANVLTQIGVSVPVDSSDGINQQSFFDICRHYFPRKPGFMSMAAQALESVILSNNWQEDKCKPQLILIQEYSENKLTDQEKEKLIQFGYQQSNSYQNFAVFLQADLKDKFQRMEEKNKPLLQKKLVSFSSLIKRIGEKVLMKSVEIGEMVQGNIIPKQLSIHFAIRNRVVDIPELIQQNPSQVKAILIMEFNPSWNALTLPEPYHSSELIEVSQVEKYFHISFRYQGESAGQAEPAQYHVYIFDHAHADGWQGLKVQRLNQLSINKFGQAEIQKFQIKNYEKLNAGKYAQSSSLKQNEDDEQTNKQLKQRLKAVEQLLKLREEQLEDSKVTKKSSDQKEAQKKEELQWQEKVQVRTEEKPTPGIAQPPISTQRQRQKGPTSQPPSHIANLTPEMMFSNQEVKNTTIMIIILVSSVLGSIALTAVVTACLMKQRHRAHVRSRIKHNAEMQSDVQEVRTEQICEDKFSGKP